MTLFELQEYCLANAVSAFIDGDTDSVFITRPSKLAPDMDCLVNVFELTDTLPAD